ncbi:hypothetical protein C0J52_23446, partial [Blattella germanica]
KTENAKKYTVTVKAFTARFVHIIKISDEDRTQSPEVAGRRSQRNVEFKWGLIDANGAEVISKTRIKMDLLSTDGENPGTAAFFRQIVFRRLIPIAEQFREYSCERGTLYYFSNSNSLLFTGIEFELKTFSRACSLHEPTNHGALSSLHCSSDGCGEETVDDGVGGGVEGRQALDEGGHRDVGLGPRHVSVHLQEIEHDVRAPADHKHCEQRVPPHVTNGNTLNKRTLLTEDDDEGHLNCLNFSFGNDSPGTCSPAIMIFLLELLMTKHSMLPTRLQYLVSDLIKVSDHIRWLLLDVEGYKLQAKLAKIPNKTNRCGGSIGQMGLIHQLDDSWLRKALLNSGLGSNNVNTCK